MTTKIAIVLTAASVALLAFGWGLGRVSSTDVDSAESDLVTLGQLEDLDGRYREAMARIDALEEAWNKRRRLDQTLTALTEELRELGNPAARDGTNGDSGGEARQLGHVGVWGELLDLDLDDSSLWELLHFRGDFENMARFVDELESWCTEKLSSPDLTEVELARLEAILHRTLFRKGYIRFALGDIEEARGAFREQIAAVDELEEALVSEGKELKEFEPVTAIYRDRSQRLLEALDTVAGKPAPADFQLGDGWVTERRASLFDLGGKTVAVFFRRAGDTRSAGVMGRLSAFCASQPDMEVVTLCWHTQDLEAQTKKLRAELEQVNYQGIAGFDPDGVGQSLFQTYRAAVGSASLYILDSRGEVVWLMEDPRTQDFAFTKTLLLRIAGK